MAAGVPVASSSNVRTSVSVVVVSGRSGPVIRSAKRRATSSSVVASSTKSSARTTKCTGWSRHGCSRGWSGPASRSTMFGVPRSFDFRLTCELLSWTALVMTPATTERSRGSSSNTGMSVGARRWPGVGKMRRWPHASPALSGR